MDPDLNIIKNYNNFPLLGNSRNFPLNADSFFSSSERDKVKGTYFLVKSKSNEFMNLNPFWIQKGFDGITTDIEKINKQRDGSLLVLTKNQKGSLALKKAVKFGNLYDITVEEHPYFNNTQGLIYCYDLKSLDQNEILKELESQAVVNVHAMTKLVNGVRIATGLYVLTFKSLVLPQYIKIGYLTLKVKIYIPNPMRCISCQNYGHTQKVCKSETKICCQCSNPLPHEKCGPTKCYNCQEEHASSSKQCPSYIKEAKIMEIKTLENVSITEARKRHNNRTKAPDNSFMVTTSDNHLIMKEIEDLRKELETFKQKDIEYKEKIESELNKNAKLVELNSKLLHKVKICDLANRKLIKENQELKKASTKSNILNKTSMKSRGKLSGKKLNVKPTSDDSDDGNSSDSTETLYEYSTEIENTLRVENEITDEETMDLLTDSEGKKSKKRKKLNVKTK